MAVNDYLRTSSIDVEGNLNFRRLEDKKRYNSWILGDGLRAEMGHESVSNNLTSRPPSWTQPDAKLSHAFVILPLSASQHEKIVLNAYVSGTVALETSTVPASGTVYYDKRSRFVRKVYALTASSNTPGNSNVFDYFFPLTGWRFRLAGNSAFTNLSPNGDELIFVDGGGADLYFTSSAYPDIEKTFKLNVPDYGKIRDIKVWVELAHYESSVEAGPELDKTVIAIRSPNVFFESGYVLRNDPRVPLQLHHGGTPPFTGGLKTCFRNSYILWGGMEGISPALGSDDWGFRTVFWDSSKMYNPKHLNHLFRDGGAVANHAYVGLLTESLPREKYNNYFSVASGSTPWTSEMGLVASSQAQGGMTGSPPSGWLTGPGGKAAENEWPTTGINWGPDYIRPMYPLLDDVIETRPASSSRKGIKEYAGFRPGLRGTEIHGDWELVIGSMWGSSQDTDVESLEFFFRQFRLEILYEQNYSVPISRFSLRKSGFANFGREETLIMSGFNLMNTHTPDPLNKVTNRVFPVNQYNPYGTTVGIVDSTSSLVNFAVFTRITGALADRLSGSTYLHTWYSFLNNQFGTPYIPISSGSGEDPSLEVFNNVQSNNKIIAEIFKPSSNVMSSYTLRSSLASKGTTKQVRDIVQEKVSGSV